MESVMVWTKSDMEEFERKVERRCRKQGKTTDLLKEIDGLKSKLSAVTAAKEEAERERDQARMLVHNSPRSIPCPSSTEPRSDGEPTHKYSKATSEVPQSLDGKPIGTNTPPETASEQLQDSHSCNDLPKYRAAREARDRAEKVLQEKQQEWEMAFEWLEDVKKSASEEMDLLTEEADANHQLTEEAVWRTKKFIEEVDRCNESGKQQVAVRLEARQSGLVLEQQMKGKHGESYLSEACEKFCSIEKGCQDESPNAFSRLKTFVYLEKLFVEGSGSRWEARESLRVARASCLRLVTVRPKEKKDTSKKKHTSKANRTSEEKDILKKNAFFQGKPPLEKFRAKRDWMKGESEDKSPVFNFTAQTIRHIDGPEWKVDRVYRGGWGPDFRHDLFEDLQPILKRSIQGQDVQICTIGQSGAGKSHAVLKHEASLLPRVFSGLAKEHKDKIRVAFLDQYTTTVRRCKFLPIHAQPNSGNGEKLIYEVKYENLRTKTGKWDWNTILEPVSDTEDFRARANAVAKKRVTRGMAVNEESSRSNLVMHIVIEGQGSITLFDMAGKEEYPDHTPDETKTEHKQIRASIQHFIELMRLLVKKPVDEKELRQAYKAHALTWIMHELPKPQSMANVVVIGAMREKEHSEESKWMLKQLEEFK